MIKHQIFSSNFIGSNRLSCSALLSMPLRNELQNNKSYIPIFFHLDKIGDIEKILQKFLNLFADYNNIGPGSNFNISILRNFKSLEETLQNRADDLKELTTFLKSIQKDLMKLIMITFLKREVDPIFIDENYDFNSPAYFIFLEKIREILNSDYNIDHWHSQDLSLTLLFTLNKFIKDVPNSDWEIIEVKGLKKMAEKIHKNLEILIKAMNFSEMEKKNFLLDLKRRYYMKMLTMEEMHEFLSDVVLVNIFHILITKGQISPKEIKKIIKEYFKILQMKDEVFENLNNFSSFVHFINETICKVEDGDIGNCMFLKRVHSQDHLTIGINPIVLGLLFNVMQLKSYQKKENVFYFKDANLPKITLINIDGYESMENYYLLRKVKNIQMISIFLENDELRISEEIDLISQISDHLKKRKRFHTIPLRNMLIDPKNYKSEIKSKDVLQIFEKIVFPLIKNFKPNLIVMSHNLALGAPDSNNNIMISPNVFSIIMHNLGLLSNHKVIFVPVIKTKNECFDNSNEKQENNLLECLLKKYNAILEYKNQFYYQNEESLMRNRLYIYEILSAFLNVTSGNTKKNFITKKPTYFNCGYVEKSNFFPYLRNLIDKKYNLIPYMKKRNLAIKDQGKFEKNMQKFQSLIIQSDPEDLTLSNSMFKSNLYKNLTLKNKFNDPTQLDDENPKFFTSKISLIHPVEEKIIVFELIFPEGNKFFFSDQTTFCVNYNCGIIFFLNNPVKDEVKTTTKYQNFMSNFDLDFEKEKELIVKPMPFYSSDETVSLVDFSLCYSETHLFLIWGRYRNTTTMNENIFAYEIQHKKWRIITMQSDFLKSPRLNASSVCFKLKKQHFIYILGGYISFKENNNDFYDLVDYLILDLDDELLSSVNRIQFEKKHYKDNYKNLLDSQIIPIPISAFEKTKTPQKLQALMFGGSFDKFIFNQEKKPLNICEITFDNLSEIKVEFNYFYKFNKQIQSENFEGLNLLFSTQSKNYYFIDENRLAIAPMLFSKEKSGIFFNFNETPSFATKGLNFQELGNKKLINMTKLEIFQEKKQKTNHKIKYILSMIKRNGCTNFPIFMPILKDQDKPVFLIKQITDFSNFFQISSEFCCILIEEDISELILLKNKDDEYPKKSKKYLELEILNVNFYTSDLKKHGMKFCEKMTPSKLKTSNYAQRKDQLFILLNNEKETQCRRKIYSLNLSNLDKNSKNVELSLVYDHKNSVLKDSSLTCDSKFIYVVGGQIADQKKYDKIGEMTDKLIEKEYCEANFYYNITKNIFMGNFSSNISEMSNPYITNSDEFLFCFERKVIRNPFLEIIFLGNKVEESILDNLEKISEEYGNYLYGEAICKNNIEQNEWIGFLVNLDKSQIIFAFCRPNKIVLKNEIVKADQIKCVSFGLNYLGQISKKKGVSFIHTFKKDGKENVKRKYQKKLIFCDFEEFSNQINKVETKIEFNPFKEQELDEGKQYFDDVLFQIRDCTHNPEQNFSECLLTQDLQKINMNEEYLKMEKDMLINI